MKGSWNAVMEKPDFYRPSLPHVVTINGLQVLLISITCLHSYPIERGYLPYSPPTQPPSIHASSHQQMTRKTPSHSLHPGYKSELRTAVQDRFSLELAHCSDSISHSNKLYFPLFCLLSGNSFPTRAWTTTFLVARTGTLGPLPSPPFS